VTPDERRARNLAAARRLLDAMGRRAVDELLAEYADDAVLELPYAPGGLPREHRGKDAAAAFMRETVDLFSTYSNTVDALFATDDPGTVVAEVRGHGVVAANGRPYEQTYVLVLRFDDAGRLLLWREYYDPGVVLRAVRA
jgi:ketosteroid isomerase-like protein